MASSTNSLLAFGNLDRIERHPITLKTIPLDEGTRSKSHGTVSIIVVDAVFRSSEL
jgi:hypothetical protein